jgi:hypothetical protein
LKKLKNKAFLISINGGEYLPAHELFSRVLSEKDLAGNCLKQLNEAAPIKVILGHSSGIMDGFARIAKEAFTPENKARADELESLFERTEGPIILFDFGLAFEGDEHAPEKETLLPAYPKESLGGNPFILIHKNGAGVVYWNPKTGLVFYLPHDAELIKIIQVKAIKGILEIKRE